MGWTVRGLNPGGSEVFRTQPPTLWLAGFSRRQSGLGVALTTQPPLVLRLKKEQGYTSTPALGFCGLL
jgi:hypothetical protein